METFPKLGLTFEQVRSRLRKDEKYKYDGKLTKSLLNQCKLHEGEKAQVELAKEMESTWGRRSVDNHSRPKVGYNPLYDEKFDKIFK